MDLIPTVSIIAAFFAGMVALFAPCCITYLLPSYLGSIFKNKNQIVLMTLIFAAGIATIMVPTALGIRAIGELFLEFHTQTYIIGGGFMILLALMQLTGKKITLPMLNIHIDLNKNHSLGSVYLLGVVSGITSSCCTPVLAGILTLSFLSPTFFLAALAGLAYVAGMVAPLVIISLFLEKVNFASLPKIRNKKVNILGRNILVSDAIAGVIFLGIGVLFIFFAATDRVIMGETKSLDQTLGPALAIVRWMRSIPASEYIFSVSLLSAGILLAKYLWKK